jgi:hypothetical protein
MTTESEPSEAVERLRNELSVVDLALDLPGSEEARRERTELIDQIDDYLLPRLRRLDAPLLAVLGGSTGAGKSTITNSLVGVDVTPSGVLRPTTRSPVLVCHPLDLEWFEDPEGVLSGLPRSTGKSAVGATGLRLITSSHLEPGLAILDAPDIDSVELANHDLAAQLLVDDQGLFGVVGHVLSSGWLGLASQWPSGVTLYARPPDSG